MHTSVPTSINRPIRRFLNRLIRGDVFVTALFEDHSKLRFPWSVMFVFTSMCVIRSTETVNLTFVYNLCAGYNSENSDKMFPQKKKKKRL